MDGHTVVIYKQKRKAALIGVLTLGLAGLTLVGMGFDTLLMVVLF